MLRVDPWIDLKTMPNPEDRHDKMYRYCDLGVGNEKHTCSHISCVRDDNSDSEGCSNPPR